MSSNLVEGKWFSLRALFMATALTIRHAGHCKNESTIYRLTLYIVVVCHVTFRPPENVIVMRASASFGPKPLHRAMGLISLSRIFLCRWLGKWCFHVSSAPEHSIKVVPVYLQSWPNDFMLPSLLNPDARFPKELSLSIWSASLKCCYMYRKH